MSQLLQFYKSFQQARMPATKPAPTFEDLTIDDRLTEHQRLVRYAKSSIGLQRLVHVKMIGEVAKNIGFFETLHSIIPLLDDLSKDTEAVIRQHLVEQLKTLAKFCYDEGGEDGYKAVRDKLLPITAALLEDEKQEVRQSASMTLVEIAQLIRHDEIGQYVLTIILRLAHEDDKEEMRMTAAQLLNLLAESLGQDLCRQFVIPEVVSLAEDPVFRVRKSTALNFHSVCKVGGEHELLERLMPAFVRLSKDDMYRVRRACAESLSEISKNVNEDIRLGVLVEIFLRLTHDPSKLVKQTILQQSGMFIATLPAKAVNENILAQYLSMANSPTGDAKTDSELRHICAYSFPAVLHVIGRQRWKEVRDLYHSLAATQSTNIKQTLAYSLHEIARMLEDEQLVEEELVPDFEDLIQDTEVVQMGVIKHLAPFLRMLPELCRVSYLPILHEILHSTNPFNWRLRQSLAIQLPQLVALPSKADVHRTLFPTLMTLLQDPVASVRRETFSGVSAFLNAVYEVALNERNDFTVEDSTMAKKNLVEITKSINQFITSEKCYLRQLWMELALQLLKDLPRVYFEQEFWPGVLQIVLDPVLNVRLAAAMFFTGWYPEFPAPWEEEAEYEDDSTEKKEEGNGHHEKRNSPFEWLLQRKDAKKCVERLSKDDKDVYNHISMLKLVYPDIEFRHISCRGRKTAPGGITPIEVDGSEVPQVDPTLLESAFYNSERDRIRSNSATSLRGRSGSLEAMAQLSSGDLAHHHGGSDPSFSGKLRSSFLDEDDEDDESAFQDAAGAGLEIDGLDLVDEAAVASKLSLRQNATPDHHEHEHEYIPSAVLGAETMQELDIIDGIFPPQPHHQPQQQNSSPRQSFLHPHTSSQLVGAVVDIDIADAAQVEEVTSEEQQDETS